MIGVLIFYLHVVGVVTVFTRNWQRGGMSEGFLGSAFFALIFSVGWTFASFVLKLTVPQEGLGEWCDRNTLSLVLLTALEYLVYKLSFRDYLFRSGKKVEGRS